MKLEDLTGRRFGKLVVVKRVESTCKNVKWQCKCDCGKYTSVFGIDLKNNKTKSCGCIHSERLSERNFKHGLSNTRLSNIWRGMKERCYNSNEPAYANYGGRGITVCEEWRISFEAFYKWAMANGYREDLSIDRIDVNGNYEPSNCRWATRKEQANNTRRNHMITYCGKTQTLTQWANEYNIKPNTLKMRLRRGWTIEKALSTH